MCGLLSCLNRVFVLVGCLTFVTPVGAQVTIGPEGPQAAGTESATSPSRPDEPRVIQMNVVRAAPSTPALEYRFRVPLFQQRPGNAAPIYYRAFREISWPSAVESREKIYPLLDMPLDQIAQQQSLETQLSGFESLFEQLETAVAREECNWDWRMQDLTGPRVVEFLLPEMQDAREVARILVVKIRWHLSRGEYEQAEELLKYGYTLGRDVSRNPSMIVKLVGIAITSMMNEQVREWIGRPDAPNLYWALADLPRPPIAMDEAIEAEANWAFRIFPLLAEAETANYTPEQWQARLARLASELSGFTSIMRFRADDGQRNLLGQWMLAGMVMQGYPRAKRALIEQGMSEQRVEAMPISQVVAVYQARLLREAADEVVKWQSIPIHQSWRQRQQFEDELKQKYFFRPGTDQGELLPVMSLLLPAVTSAAHAEARCTAQLNLLQTVESLRYQLAETGEWPATLEEITVAPAPLNPFTNRPFQYEVDGAVARLQMDVPEGYDRQNGGMWQLQLHQLDSAN